MADDDPHHQFMLCDYAEVVNGKLYIMGGGISDVLPIAPANVALALLLYVPWSQTNRPQTIHIALVDEDGDAVAAGPDGAPLTIDGQFEVGRPPGSKHGSTFPTALAVRLPPLLLPPAAYRFELHLNGSIAEVVSFRVRQM